MQNTNGTSIAIARTIPTLNCSYGTSIAYSSIGMISASSICGIDCASAISMPSRSDARGYRSEFAPLHTSRGVQTKKLYFNY